MKSKAALSVLVVCFVTHAEAQSEGISLSLQQLLRQVSISHQGMEIARARIRAAEASEMAARGAFDLQIEAHARTAPVGRYGSSSAIVGVRQPTTIHGLDLGLWYENGADFPSYSEEFITSTDGKVSLKALLPLLRNGRVASDRYRRFEARLSREIAERSAAQVRADLFAAASRAWWNWA